MHFGRQAKHLPDSPEFIPGRSIVTLPVEKIQELIARYGGIGKLERTNRELIDFGIIIGIHVDNKTGKRKKTTRGWIHYSKYGAHIVPAPPEEPKGKEDNRKKDE